MKTRKKVLLITIIVIFIVGIIFALLFMNKQNKIKKDFAYCADKIRAELGENLENISIGNTRKYNGKQRFEGSLTYTGIDYNFVCLLGDKNEVEIKMVEVVDVISQYDNGAIKETGKYVDDMKQGVRTTYDEDGNIIEIEKYKDGELVIEPENNLKISNFEELNNSDGYPIYQSL